MMMDKKASLMRNESGLSAVGGRSARSGVSSRRAYSIEHEITGSLRATEDSLGCPACGSLDYYEVEPFIFVSDFVRFARAGNLECLWKSLWWPE
jgi:hypothetical protein